MKKKYHPFCSCEKPPSVAGPAPPAAHPASAGTGSKPVGVGLEGVAGTLWNLLYNKSLMGKPAVGSSLYPEMAKEGNVCS